MYLVRAVKLFAPNIMFKSSLIRQAVKALKHITFTCWHNNASQISLKQSMSLLLSKQKAGTKI